MVVIYFNVKLYYVYHYLLDIVRVKTGDILTNAVKM